MRIFLLRSTINRELKLFVLLLVVLVTSSKGFSQPGDCPLSVLPVDEYGYVNGQSFNYQLFSCHVNYPRMYENLGDIRTAYQPDLKTLEIRDTLHYFAFDEPIEVYPYNGFFQSRSCNETDILMIIRNRQDTMLINSGGAYRQLWRYSPYGENLGLPFVFYFQKGIFFFSDLNESDDSKRLFNAVHREFLLLRYSTEKSTEVVKGSITEMHMTKRNYAVNDVVSVNLTGRMLNDGGCAGRNLIWTLQRLQNDDWEIVRDECCTQMDCGVGPAIGDHQDFPLFVCASEILYPRISSPQILAFPNGQYRVIVYDEFYRPYIGDMFWLE
jgi:hypothetical protein